MTRAMAPSAPSGDPRSDAGAEPGLSLVRLYILRAMYVVLVIGLGAMIVPEIASHPLTSRGVIPSLLGAIWLLAFLGLRYPVEMIPLLLFEFDVEGDLDGRLRTAAMVGRPISADFHRRFLQYRVRRGAAAGHTVGLCLAPFRQAPG